MSTKYIIKIEEDLFHKAYHFLIQQAAKDNNERFCFLFCHTAVNQNDVIFLPRKIMIFQEKDIEITPTSVQIKPEAARMAYIQFIESEYTGLIDCHSHPFQETEVSFSPLDDRDDIQKYSEVLPDLQEGKKLNHSQSLVYMHSMVFGKKNIASRTFDVETAEFVPTDKIVLVGETIKEIEPANKGTPGEMSEAYKEIVKRQVAAFGEEGQKKIQNLKVGVVGIGGIGSIVAEGLCRIGVRNLLLIDDDTIEASNLNRWQGGKPSDVGKKKVTACARNLKAAFDGIQIEKIPKSLFSRQAFNALKTVDCMIGGLDNPETRYFLNRISLQYLIPYLDAGVVIETAKQTEISGLKSRVGIVIPGITRCFDCSGIEYYDKKEVGNFFLDITTKEEVRRAGYIIDAENINAPAVYPLNMLVSGMLLLELMNLFTGYKEGYWNIQLDFMDMNTTIKKSCGLQNEYEEPDPSCLLCHFYKGLGDFESLAKYYDFRKKMVFPLVSNS